MNALEIIDTLYSENAALRRILIEHSEAVARKALALAEAKPELPIDKQFVYDAAMLHDIGIIMCDAPGIECYGKEPYIRHGMCGAEILRTRAVEWGVDADEIEPYARVCERHTGAGLTATEIEAQNLPLPHVDLLPETMEEKLICYADKFFSKTHVDVEKPFERVLQSMQKFGGETVSRFQTLHEIFE